jgi:trk system potassium uptake protein
VTAAVPLYLSGHYGSWLDASFEGLSGLTTSGLTLVQDLDHLATSLMLYRHLLELIGAMAIVIAGLTILTAPTATASSLAPSDARDERILPSLDRTARRVLNVGGAVLVPGSWRRRSPCSLPAWTGGEPSPMGSPWPSLPGPPAGSPPVRHRWATTTPAWCRRSSCRS